MHACRSTLEDPTAATPGQFRKAQNWIGARGSTPATATYVPPPPAAMTECLANWESFVRQRDAMPDLVQCALVHEQFEAIHPFLDGNGRVGRLLITLFLVERGRLSQPLLYLSDFIESNRRDYYDALQEVRTRGDWGGWLRYFLHGVRWTARKAIHQASQLVELRESLRVKLRASPRAVTLVDALFVNPYMTVARAADVSGVTLPTARKAIQALQDARVVREMTGRSWGRVYVCASILDAIEHPTAERGA